MLPRSGAVALLLLGLLPISAATAQGVLQNPFGFSTQPSRTLPPPATYRVPPSANPGVYRDLFEEEAPQPTYRSVCVRLCDGYYFPVSFATTQNGLRADAEKCSASCSSEARLFFQPSPGEDIGAARDFLGLQYESLPNAFKYRKALVAGCQCKPQPWSAEERQRHQRYAVRARKLTVSPNADAPVVEIAGSERPLALMRRASPETEAKYAPPPAAQDNLRQPAPMAMPAPAPRPGPFAIYDLFGGTRAVVYGLPAPPPRRR